MFLTLQATTLHLLDIIIGQSQSIYRIQREIRGQSNQPENQNWEKLPRTGISHAKLVVGVVSWQ